MSWNWEPRKLFSRRLVAPLDPLLLILLFLLSVFGLGLLYSATNGNADAVLRQGIFTAIGFVLMFAVAHLPLRDIKIMAFFAALIGFGLLLLTLAFGVELNGSQRWLPVLPGIVLQPSELMKTILPFVLAVYLGAAVAPGAMMSVGQTLIGSALICTAALLVILQPDLGTAVMLLVSGAAAMLLGGLRRYWVFGSAALVLVSPWLIWPFLAEYQRQRVLTFLNPGDDPLGAGWNISQSLIAIGSGGIEGKGYLQGTQSHLDFVPESHTDFIFSVLAEEGGLISCLVLMVLFAAVLWRTLALLDGFRARAHRIFAAAFVVTFILQGMINIAMACALLPVVGLPLPLISQGGSGKIAALMGFGLIMAMSYHRHRYRFLDNGA
ncbi:MAG: rod shape-determining protein RodA [Gammaproteobacteria bacterium AqS3]|nr:rod shape-determining protein RodA [Gammaproteobacteria bacterium AqS3]